MNQYQDLSWIKNTKDVEELHFSNPEYAKLTMDALHETVERTQISNLSIYPEFWKDGGVTYYIAPTQIGFIYAWFSLCGRLYEKSIVC